MHSTFPSLSRYFLYDIQFHVIYYDYLWDISTTSHKTPTSTAMEENHHQKTSSREYIFSFPSTPGTLDQDSDFEFGCLTPDSPSCDPNKNSPADHLFFNGRLLPHSFPVLRQQQPTTMLLIDNIYRATSRASSVSCKDSLMSSRSNSTNSSRSSVSSARTSSSDNSERRRLYNSITSTKTPLASKVVMAQLYGSSQRWQHIMPVPTAVLKREDSRRKSGGILVKEGLVSNKKQVKKGKRERSGLWRRFFMSFLVACRECHAMEPSTRDDMLQENIKLWLIRIWGFFFLMGILILHMIWFALLSKFPVTCSVCDHTAKSRPLSRRVHSRS